MSTTKSESPYTSSFGRWWALIASSTARPVQVELAAHGVELVGRRLVQAEPDERSVFTMTRLVDVAERQLSGLATPFAVVRAVDDHAPSIPPEPATEAAHHPFTPLPAPVVHDPRVATKTVEQPAQRLLNRELSWLELANRVLDLAADESQPLLERVKFCSIFSSILDEFFMVRVAGLIEQEATGVGVRSADGLTSQQALAADPRARGRADEPAGAALEARAAAGARGGGHRDRRDRGLHARRSWKLARFSSARSIRC